MIILWILIIIFFDFNCVNKIIDKTKKINMKNVKKIFVNGFSIFAITLLGLYLLNAPKYAIDNYLENSFQTIFGIIVMPATAISLFGQFLLHPYLTLFTKYVESNDYKDLSKLVKKIILYVVGFGILAAILAYFAGIPVLQFVYGIDLNGYKEMLSIIIISSTIYNIGYMYSNVLITMRKNYPQLGIYLILTIVAYISSNILTKKYQILGATISYFIIMFTMFTLYLIVSKIIIKRKIKEISKD